MMLMTTRENRLCQALRNFPYDYNLRYTEQASQALLETLFRSLAAEDDRYLRGFFQDQEPGSGDGWDLSKAQGMTEDMEYTEAARGKACGHIYKTGDSVFRCKTCTTDDTAVLCTRCFEASDHTGHIVTQNISLGNSGCCDCGDDEAWRIPVKCAIHSDDDSQNTSKDVQIPVLPDELLESIRMTISRVIDYLIDVLSCSPENLRLVKTEESIRKDEEQSRLGSVWYHGSDDASPEYALILWNDEKHTVKEVEDQVSRACKQKRKFGETKANETNDFGRSVIEYSKDVKKLLRVAKIIEEIKITVTIRSSRDTFREQMCGTIIEWLHDIAGCSVGQHHDVLRLTICEELLSSWRLGSEGFNKNVGKDGLDDHDLEEYEDLSNVNFLAQVMHQRRLRNIWVRRPLEDSESDSPPNEEGEDDQSEGSGGQTIGESAAGDDQMDLDIMNATNTHTDGDQAMRTPNDMEDGAELSEATFAGYPPPPPPPPAPPIHQHTRVQSIGSQISEPLANITFASSTNIEIPPTPKASRVKARSRPPGYWLQQPDNSTMNERLPLHEDLRRRIRLDWLLLYDLRLWKKVRIDLRDLYIKTLISNPQTKRIFGLRFAGLYSVLGQLYLIADREPDHSIINLSVQTFTTPSVTQEVIERGNFLTTLFSMLYTFLTQRAVQHPWQVSVDDSMVSDNTSVSNRRMYHFFLDLKHMFGAEYVRNQLCTQERYQLQFLDLIRLPQGICPNIRAVGEHVEYENDVWISAQILTKEINKLVRQFAEIFHPSENMLDEDNLCRILRSIAKATVVNAIGGERVRFAQAEIKFETRFKSLEPFYFERSVDSSVNHSVVDFVVEKEWISFHHPLQYTLSWLIDGSKGIGIERLRELLTFSLHDLRQPPPYKALVPDQSPEDYLMAVFDFPLRVCAWLAQMKAGMWVRNGLSLRHQMTTYRGVAHRDLAHHRDIFLLQTAMVVCDSSRVLASMIDRFGLDQWMRGHYTIRNNFEPNQQLDVAEDFVHLLIILLSDRTTLQLLGNAEDSRALSIRRDIAHILCFKPLSFSELNQRFADKSTDLEDFQDILDQMTNYRPPEGLSDTGSFELKPEYLDEIDPYAAHYTKNQRDEAENAYRAWIAKRSGKPVTETVYEPKLALIPSGIFTGLGNFTATPLFAQIIFYSLSIASNTHRLPDIPSTRIEAYLHVVLHLTLVGVLEDSNYEDVSLSLLSNGGPSFIKHILQLRSELGLTVFDLLFKMMESPEIKTCHPQIRLILLRIRQKRPESYKLAVSQATGSAAGLFSDDLGFEVPPTPGESDQEIKLREARQLKKQQALDRQARVMAQFQQQQQNFLNNQDISDWEEEDDSISVGEMEDQASKTWKFPAGNCILCQEETNETRLYGTFGLLTNSRIFRQTDARDSEFVGEILLTPDRLDQSAEALRPFGIAGSNRTSVIKRAPSGQECVVDRQGLAKGFPPAFTSREPVSTGCGHIMHYSCFETYCAATQRRHDHQIARQHPENLELKEFVCPLCKALGNAFLPIIWRGKEVLSHGSMQTELPFEEWLSAGVGITVSRFFKTQEGASRHGRLQELFTNYASRAMILPLANSLSSSEQHSATSPTSPQPGIRPWFSGLPGFRHSDFENRSSPERLTTEGGALVFELMSVFARLRDTIRVNKLYSHFTTAHESEPPSRQALTNADTLARIFGQTITSVEIAQRGIPSEHGQSLIDKIPLSTLTHLRIFSETVSSYIALGVKMGGPLNTSALEFSESTKLQMLQLFAGHPHINTDSSEMLQLNLPPALTQDPFVLLAECSIILTPAFNIEIRHVLHLCYILEVVKVSLYLSSARGSFQNCHQQFGMAMANDVSSSSQAALHAFLLQLRTMTYNALAGGDILDSEFPGNLALLFKAISKYAQVFLRKAMLFMHVRYGMDFSGVAAPQADISELDYLSNILHLPSLTDLLKFTGQARDAGASPIHLIIQGWISHWQYSQKHLVASEQASWSPQSYQLFSESAYQTLRPGHPALFELIGLPKYFDSLTYEVTRRRCPTKKGKLEDPSLCLFCGEIFCGQAQCCARKDKGGCFQHMQKCGRDVGLFLNIRKCTVLYFHNRIGSWTLAPYLDKYGEADPGLRRGRRLSLSQKRYDKLFRDVWLQQGIPTMIARKLEAEINNGGWETL